MNRTRSAAHRAPWWAWPGALVAIVALLATQGRYLVSGLLLAVVMVFALAMAGLLVWLLAGLARPGRHVSLDGPRAALRSLRSGLGSTFGRLRLALGSAPWRRPDRVLSATTALVCAEVAQLPSGPAAFPAIEVSLNPETVQRIDAWMPIEDVAWHLAAAYARQHADLPRVSDTVTVVVVRDRQVPVNRAVVRSGFRVPGNPEAAGLARAALAGRSVFRAEGLLDAERMAPQRQAPAPPQPDPTLVIRASAIRQDPEHTVRIPSATARQQPTVVVPPAEPQPTVVVPPAEPRPSDCLELIPAHPRTGEPTTQTPIVVRAPRTTIGRAADRDVQLTGSHVSRDHAEIKLLATGWVVTDRHSTRGTYVDGTAILPGIPHILQPGSLIEIGRPDRSTPATSFRIGQRAP
ncbi:MAG: FHA domain-containing protein [Candidatus Nanopelagicales bacterium]